MNDSTLVSNEAEFERWLIAALEHERQRLFEAAQSNGDRRCPAPEPSRNSAPRADVPFVIHFSS